MPDRRNAGTKTATTATNNAAGAKKGSNGKPQTTKTQTAGKAAVAKAVKPRIENWAVYPKGGEIGIELCVGDNALTAARAMFLLGWEDEDQYAARMKRENPGAKNKEWKYGDNYFIKDMHGNKVRCKKNNVNRPFDLKTALAYAQDILNREWFFNFENIIISKEKEVVSGQHRLVGLVLAEQIWDGKNREHWHAIWETAPVMEVSIGLGIEQTPEVLHTLDNVRTRTLEDIVYTDHTLFKKTLSKDTADRKPLAKVLVSATNLLWERAGVGRTGGTTYDKFMTHSLALNFVKKRHPRLITAVDEVFQINKKDRGIAQWGISGPMAAALYLMGCSATDETAVNKYRASEQPNEKMLDWSLWDKALEFVQLFAKQSPTVSAIFRARKPHIGDDGKKGYDKDGVKLDQSGKPMNVGDRIFMPKINKGGTPREKLAVVAKAWAAFSQGKRVTDETVKLTYRVDLAEDKSVMDFTLDDSTLFDGIDMGYASKAKGDPKNKDTNGSAGDPSKADIAKGKASADARKEMEAKMAAKLKGRKTKAQIEKAVDEGKTFKDIADELALAYPGRMICIQTGLSYYLIGEDAKAAQRVIGPSARLVTSGDGVKRLSIPATEFQIRAKLLTENGYRVSTAVARDDDPNSYDVFTWPDKVMLSPNVQEESEQQEGEESQTVEDDQVPDTDPTTEPAVDYGEYELGSEEDEEGEGDEDEDGEKQEDGDEGEGEEDEDEDKDEDDEPDEGDNEDEEQEEEAQEPPPPPAPTRRHQRKSTSRGVR